MRDVTSRTHMVLFTPSQLSSGVPNVEDLLSSELRISELGVSAHSLTVMAQSHSRSAFLPSHPSHLQASQLAWFVGTAVTVNEARVLLEPLLKDRSAVSVCMCVLAMYLRVGGVRGGMYPQWRIVRGLAVPSSRYWEAPRPGLIPQSESPVLCESEHALL